MTSDSLAPEGAQPGESAAPTSGQPQPSEAPNVGASSEVAAANLPPGRENQTSLLSSADNGWEKSKWPVLLVLVLVVAAAVLAAWGLQAGFKWAAANAAKAAQFRKAITDSEKHISGSQGVDPETQAHVEEKLRQLAQGDPGSADAVLEQAKEWTGKTRRTAAADQSLTAAINNPDMHVRSAALEAELALEGVPRDASGMANLEQSVGDPNQRAWALWTLGALGNRGVYPDHAAKIIDAYLNDPSADVRAAAVNGLALVGTNETVPMLLDRFRNDPSPVVQERAACGLAQSGMYTHDERMKAAGSLIGWLDDPLLTAQQKQWAVQALHDISGRNFGTDSASWQDWYNGNR
jgi:hypothetical protein